MSISEQPASDGQAEQSEPDPGEISEPDGSIESRTAPQVLIIESESTNPTESPPVIPVQESKEQNPAIYNAKIHCPKCKSENPPTALRCQNCDANLLPAEGLGQRFTTFIGFLIVSALLGYLFYRFYVQYPGTAPDIVFCNVGALAGGALIGFITAFVQLFRKTPIQVKYENRAKRHMDLNAWQALDDLNRAMDLAKDKEQGNLIKQRAKVYEKLGLADDAARDYLALATSTGAYKDVGEWVSALTGADAETISSGMVSGQISVLLQSGKAKAVGYCRQCDNVVVLNTDQHCQTHPKKKVKEVEFVIPNDVMAGKLAVMQRLEPRSKKLSEKITEMLESGKANAIGYCPRCKAAVALNSSRRCMIHPKVKGRHVQYFVPGREADAKQATLRWRRDQKIIGRKRNYQIFLIIAMIIMAFGLYLVYVRGF